MHVVTPIVVGAHDRPDHHHGGARGADEARQHHADEKEHRVGDRRAVDVARITIPPAP
jgi:hypothetical protein